MIRVALGTAKVLGLVNIKMKILPTTAHVMNSGKCMFDCKFCTQAKSSVADQKMLSRIAWPEYEAEKVLRLLKQKQREFKRVCLQVVHSNGNKNFLSVLEDIRASCNIPISVDAKAEDMDLIRGIFNAGADIIGLPIDVANPEVYSEIKQGSFKTHLELIERAAKEYNKRVSTHLIIGLGESEKDAVELITEMHRHDVTMALFAFTPVKGTELENMTQPRIEHYRRIQLARFLIYNGFKPSIGFDENNKIIDFGYGKKELFDMVSSSAFETSGCPGCNRPFYNEIPSGTIYNYPYELSRNEFDRAFREAISGLEGFDG